MPYTPPNYAPTVSPGDVRRRIWHITGENPNPLDHVGAVPSLVFHEEEVIKLSTPNPNTGASERTLGRTRDLSVQYTDPNRVLPLLNPVDDTPLVLDFGGVQLASLPYALAMAVLYSLGRHAQTTSDVAEAALIAAREAAEANGPG